MILVDSSVILDVLTGDRRWFEWSAEQLRHLDGLEGLAINPIIYAEITCRQDRREVDRRTAGFHRLALPFEAAWRAGRAFAAYRDRGGRRTAPLPDFFIGAHADAARLPLLPRDPTRVRTCFPDVRIVAPDLG